MVNKPSLTILGIETSCDECSSAIVRDGQEVLANIVYSQLAFHERYQGVVPEIASRKHIQWITLVVRAVLAEAGLEIGDIDGYAATSKPGLSGALLVGLSMAKSLAWAQNKPIIGIDHIKAHLYSCQLEHKVPWPFLGIIVSGGHSIISRSDSFDHMLVLGSTIDDAIGEAFDKVAKFHNLGFPGGAAIDALAQKGNPDAFEFLSNPVIKGDHPYDLSYSGLKTAATHQHLRFLKKGEVPTMENLAASFQKAAVDMLARRIERAARDQGLTRIVFGGGVAANRFLRSRILAIPGLEVFFPSAALCGDNAAMVAGLGYHYLAHNKVSSLDLGVTSRVGSYHAYAKSNGTTSQAHQK